MKKKIRIYHCYKSRGSGIRCNTYLIPHSIARLFSLMPQVVDGPLHTTQDYWSCIVLNEVSMQLPECLIEQVSGGRLEGA